MKALWTRQAKRIDALSLRERVVMFFTIAVALGAVADRLMLEPLLEQRRQLVAQIRKETADLSTLRSKVAASRAQTLPDTPQGRLLTEIERLRSASTDLEARARSLLVGPEEIARLNDVLDRVLRRHDRLTLTRLSTVTENAPSRAAATPAAAASAPPAGNAPAVRWQGVDVGLAGRYLDLMSYLADLERALPGVRWGELKIATKTTPPELTVRLLMAGENP